MFKKLVLGIILFLILFALIERTVCISSKHGLLCYYKPAATIIRISVER